MKKSILALFGFLLFSQFSCEKTNLGSTKDDDEKQLAELYTEIEQLSNSIPCDDPSIWKFTALGTKACGGPVSYITYASTIDTVDFLAKVERYTNLQGEYNKKWDIASDCSMVLPPDRIICKDGRPKLITDQNSL